MTTLQLQQRLEWASQAGALGELAKFAIFEAEWPGTVSISTWEAIAVSRARCAWRYAKSAMSGILFPSEQQFTESA